MLTAIPASADDGALERARRAYQRARYSDAYRLYRDALSQEGNRRQQLVDIYLHLGVLAATMDRDDEAIAHFVHALMLEPRATLANSVEPGIRKQFAAARQRSRTLQRFELRHPTVGRLTPDGTLEVEAELLPDSLGMATAVTLRYRSGGRTPWRASTRSGTGPVRFVIPSRELIPGSDVEYHLWVRDAYGGILHELGHERAPLLARATGSAEAAPEQATAGAYTDAAPLPLAAPGASTSDEPGAAGDRSDSGRAVPGWVWFAAGTGALVLVAGAAAVTAVALTIRYTAGVDFEPIATEVAQLH
ncbi:MAG: hypothetical protein JXR83_13700 [Deltaproteobacteria bacterium]|nr:hypothetical protein [Deltaproteobacteria bacterium]